MKKILKSKKGFTLAELLIVVAIIGVLVAISIPIFTSQLEKAREATDLANIRAAYAECSSAVLTGEDPTTAATDKLTEIKDGSDVVGYSKTVDLQQKKAGWTGDNKNAKIGNKPVSDLVAEDGVTQVTIGVWNDGTVNIADGASVSKQ